MISAYRIDNEQDFSFSPAELPGQGAPLPPDIVWIDLVAPSPEECRLIAGRFSIPLDHLRAALDSNERPREEREDNSLLLLVRAPFRDDPMRRVPFSTCPLAVILTPEVVVTVCLREHLAANLVGGKTPGKGIEPARRLALTMLLRVSSAFIDHLRLMDERVGAMEDRLKASMRNKELLQMLHVEKSLIYFLTALKGNQSVLEKARNCPYFATAPSQALLDDVFIENRQATDMAEIFSRVLESLGDAFGAIISNNLNKVMKVLTGLTIVLMIPSIVAALYGMNVLLPGQDSPHAFTVLGLLCLVLCTALFLVLRKKDWM